MPPRGTSSAVSFYLAFLLWGELNMYLPMCSRILTLSPCCLNLFQSLGQQMTLKRIHREITDLKKEDLGNMVLEPTEDNMHVWRGVIPGPESSVYEGGVFNVEINLPADYP